MSFPLVCVTGTTGSGKNAVGIAVAERVAGEVLSLDSMKVYRGMDIGTAKPSAADRTRVVHHLVDVLDPTERMDLRRFLDLAEGIIAERTAAGVPLVAVGGTAMYLTGLLYGVHEGPSRDEGVRARLRAERDARGREALHARLAEIDPASAARIDPRDYQRTERALEIHELTGKPASELERAWFANPRHDARVYVVTWPRERLRARLERRVDRMFEAGWVAEVRQIRDRGGFSPEAAMALGYREILDHLDDRLTEVEARRLIKTRTWQFSRRQMTWMNNKYPDATVIVRGEADTVDAIAERIVAACAPGP